ncbi:ABC transporter ATP-binding protein [Granulosicoccaceae sp. 1_MG-2023]|nr:ABC transporter ATP-binding protein [Granulosicoccaceae sp. 1_MG-2023]
MLEVRSVSRRYGDFKAVDDVSFAVTQGEVVGLLGHNGAGKTTMMKMLSGFLEPDSGAVLFKGQPVHEDRSRLQRELGYLPENLPVYPELSVASYLDYAAQLKGLRGEEKRSDIRRVLEATELQARLLSPIATLSRGLKQRVGVAQAILGHPSLLILDEPTNGLDPAQTESMRALIRHISESATVILSTHIMQEVEAMCDRALIIRRGRLAVDASLQDLQKTSRIRLLSSAAEADLRAALADVGWLASFERLSGAQEYRLNIRDGHDAGECVAQAVRLLVEKNIPIQGIAPDVQDLQSLFLEVNAATAADSTTGTQNEDEVDHVA